MLVSRADLEDSLARVGAGVSDPRHGIHGPDSPAWKLQREAVVFLGGGRAALLQLAHPYVAYGVDQHSKTRVDVIGRFQRTFMAVFAMTFGDLQEAFTAARRVHQVHTHITGVFPEAIGPFAKGETYHANDTAALLWVYATLIDTVVSTTELVRGKLPAAEKEAYYRDTWSFARLFGIPDAVLPPDWPSFERYVEQMIASSTLTVAPPARDMARFLFGRGPGQEQSRLASVLELVTAGLLPEKLRDQFGLPFGLREKAEMTALLTAVRAGHRALPRALRYLPAYIDAERRIAGEQPSMMSAWFERRLFHLAGRVAGRASMPPRRRRAFVRGAA
ncbi:MAG TPA: oxygenase MpaB family protein [Kofleriaceae bacterium]|nr:oxygenase MpaB family protein [Kofleriaceae bacterium]